MSGYYNSHSYRQYVSSNISFDPFSSPQSGRTEYCNRQAIPQQSVDVFAETPKRRSYGENGTISRAIGNALDPEYCYQEPSMDIFGPSTSSHIDYDDDLSVLAAVSSAHSSQKSTSAPSSQEQSSSQSSISNLFRKSERKDKSRGETKYAAIFNKSTKHNDEDDDYEDPTMQDFLSPEQMERYRKQRRPRAKQIRMDDYVFKARRVDKGAREFGLHTTHEPKRGSKKKRDSIEQLEVEKIEFDKQRQKKHEKNMEKRNNEVENLDFSLAFGTPSPVRNRPKTSKLTQFFEKDSSKSTTPLKKIENNYPTKTLQKHKPSISFNDPTMYANDSILEATVCSTPDKSSLLETMPFCTPSPARKQMTPKRNITLDRYTTRPSAPPVKPNPIKRRDFGSAFHDREPLAQPKRQKMFSNNRKPEFDYPSSPITLYDEDELKVKIESPKRQSLREDEEKRRKFGAEVSEREQMMRQLVDQKFKEERENGGIERRRAELEDGQVIRNKEMRKNLMHGAACKCCRGYYDGLGMEEHEKKDYINKISRHRYVHQALPDTPEHYWDLTLGPRGEPETQMSQKKSWEASIKKRRGYEDRSGIHNWN